MAPNPPTASLRILRRSIRSGLSPQETRAVLSNLGQTGWNPVFVGMDAALLRSISAPEDSLIRPRVRLSVPWDIPDPVVSGDIFFRESETYFLMAGALPARDDHGGYGDAVNLGVELPLSEGDPSFIEVGLVTRKGENAETRLDNFVSEVHRAIMATVDGRRTRHMEFNWTVLPSHNRRLRRFVGSEAAGLEEEARSESPSHTPRPAEGRFEPAQLPAQSVTAAECMMDPITRGIVRQVSQARFATKRELQQAQPGAGAALEQATALLTTRGLLRTTYVVTCRTRSLALTRLDNLDILRDPKVGKLVCHYCGSTFDQEPTTEGYSITEFGKTLNTGNRWLTVWVTNLLVELGVPIDAILWNVSDEGEEMDIILEAFEKLWIVELKDREFGRGDAHPFSYRRTHYRPDLSIVLTTERVSDEAKRIFREIAAGERRSRFLDSDDSRTKEPIYVEGLASANASLASLIDRETSEYVGRCLSPLAELTGTDLVSLIKLRTAMPEGVGQPSEAG